jgi:hypothetical protein
MEIGADFNQQWVRIPTKNEKDLNTGFFLFQNKITRN